MKLSEAQRRERQILTVLAENSEGYHSDFNYLSQRTGIERRQVRLDCRRMWRKGLTAYGKGLWSDDGEPRGSGYTITPLGRVALEGSEK